MRVLVIYESIYGNTHLVAEAIARALASVHEVRLIPVARATYEDVASADLVFVGGPTHLHDESWSMTRSTARDSAAKQDLDLDPDAFGPGLRNWFHRLDPVDAVPAAAFDTRFDANPTFTGRASRGIGRKLRHHGFALVTEPESFLVTTDNTLVPDETIRAERWAQAVAARAPRAASAGHG